jgi:hypothetical protein
MKAPPPSDAGEFTFFFREPPQPCSGISQRPNFIVHIFVCGKGDLACCWRHCSFARKLRSISFQGEMGNPAGDGLRAYYRGKIEDLEIQIRDKQHNLRRMEAQRNELNAKGESLALRCPPPTDLLSPTLKILFRCMQSGCCARSCNCSRNRDPMLAK